MSDNFEHKKITKEERRQKIQDKMDAKVAEIPAELNGMPIIEMEYTRVPKQAKRDKRKAFGEKRKAFLKMLATQHAKTLIKEGFSDSQIEQMGKGKCPNGHSVHHKLPLSGGGKNEFKNFILIPHKPHEEIHGKILDPQVYGMEIGEKRKIKVPYTNSYIFENSKCKSDVKNMVVSKKLVAQRD
jgi:hypothetical protein